MTTAKLTLSPALKLPVEAVTQTVGILGRRGSGKSTTAAVLAEELLRNELPVEIIDPTGAHWGLRSSADGKQPGYAITILGGDHGDAPLEDSAGKVIADLVAAEAPPLVLDLSLMSKAGARRFVGDFSQRLYEKNRRALHVIYDEADEFVPQRIARGMETVFGAVDTVVRRGRIRGLGVTLISQRSAAINKDVLTQCEVLVAHRASHPKDLEPVLAWMQAAAIPDEQLAKVRETIASLANGEAWVMSPEWLDLFERTQIRQRETFNSSATPKAGERRVVPKRLAPVDLEKLKAAIGATIERAEATNPARLQRRIAELERELARKPAAGPPAPAAKVQKVEVPIMKDRDVKRLESSIAKLGLAQAKLIESQQAVTTELENLRTSLARAVGALANVHLRTAPPPPPAPRPAAPAPLARRAPPAPARIADHGNGAVELRRGERRMLEVLARTHPARRTRAQLGTLAGFTPSGGTFGTYFGVLKRHGLVLEEADGSVSITDAGLALVGGAPAAPHSPEEVLETWRRALRAGERAMLDVLVARHPHGLSREDLGRETGFAASGGTFGTYLGVLRRNGLAEVAGDVVRASDTLFLGGAA